MLANQVVGEISFPRPIRDERTRNAVRRSELQLSSAEQPADRDYDLVAGVPIAMAQHPHDLAQDDVRDVGSRTLLPELTEERLCLARLLGIVGDEDSHQDVGVERDQDRRPCDRMTSFICSTERRLPLT